MDKLRRQIALMLGRWATLLVLAWAGGATAFANEIHEAALRGDITRVRALLQADPKLVFQLDTSPQTEATNKASSD